MKRIISLVIFAIAITGAANAQKFAFVDSEYILKNIPSYSAAQDEIDKLSETWEVEVKKEYSTIDDMYKSYKSERVLLSEEMREKRENEIIAKEKSVKELQQKYFGSEGDLFNKREELVKPIQDAVYKAVKELTVEGGYAIIFDTSSGASILYSNPRFDKSDEILK
ncbi:MAG: OmpH family outer membrane protein [Bacteroidales bacterium]|jgi:outer membrane protein|nr:OmpH family outer membrane protein [Bacteroidales bacterium]